VNLYAIPAHLPFLDALAAGVLAEQPPDAPEALSRLTILLPTRRSARALRLAFLRAAGGQALLLPRLRALAGLSTEDADELALPALLDLPPAVAPLRRQAVLAGFVQRLPTARGDAATAAQAWGLAGALATLFDEIALEEKDLALLAASTPEALNTRWLERLAGLVPAEHATHWDITLIFLRAVAEDWQRWLAEQGLLDIGMRRVQALRAQTLAWEKAPPATPIIAAGIGVGGTIPAAEALLGVLARLPAGRVVLHALDAESAEPKVWEAIREAPTHPFCGQHRLLHALGATEADIRPWPCTSIAPATPADRPALLGMALRPAAGLPAWQSRRPARWAAASEGLRRLVAADAQAEAAAIALSLRGALEQPGARAALVTPDRDLAKRVSAELVRHGIVADDSAGEPLGASPGGAFLRLIAQMVAQDSAPVPLLAVLKHPTCQAGWPRDRWLAAVRRLERAALRGARPGPGLGGLRAALAEARLAPEAAEELAALLDRLAEALGGFAVLPSVPQPPAMLLAAHIAAAEALAASPELPGGARLYIGEEGEALAAHLAGLAEAMAALPPLPPSEWPALFDAALEGATAPSLRATRGRPAGPHPRVEILGLLEARLLAFDHVVLGALDETIWPLATDPGPWMSRPMRRDFGLPEPEARIGRVAADFLLAACSAPSALLSRAARRGGAPTVPARWLTRIDTFLAGQDGLALASDPAAGWAAQLDQVARPQPCGRPAPKPTRAQRPKRISVTQVELLLADPYAFYARHVLRLRALDPLDAEAGVLDYGNLVHAVLHDVVGRLSAQPWPGVDAARALWDGASAAALAAEAPRPGLAAFWAPRLARIGDFVLPQETALREAEGPLRSLVEVSGRMLLRLAAGEVEVIAKADRIDLLTDGSLRLLDYKTGSPPSPSRVRAGEAPQLPLEAAIAAAGGFADLPAGDASALIYWRVHGGPTKGEVTLVTKDGAAEVQALAAAARQGLEELIAGFLLGDRPFLARPHPKRAPRSRDYDHLARVAEWNQADADAE
jgi:ATP-dependent helicase/nuclease subunit B